MTDRSDKSQVTLRVFGQVTGVSFRYYILQQAEKIGQITGFVRNEFNGSVLIVAQGPKEKLERLIKSARQGSRLARVTKVAIDWSEPIDRFDNFTLGL